MNKSKVYCMSPICPKKNTCGVNYFTAIETMVIGEQVPMSNFYRANAECEHYEKVGKS